MVDRSELAEFRSQSYTPRQGRLLLLCGASMYFAFHVLDRIAFPELANEFLAIRLGLVGLAVIAIACLGMPAARSFNPQIAIVSVVIATAGLSLAWMSWRTGGPTSPYYAGNIIIMLFMPFVAAWPMWALLTVNTVLVTSIFGPIPFSNAHFAWGAVAINGALLISAAVISALSIRSRNALALAEFRNRRRVDEQREELEELHRRKDHMFQNVSHELRTPLTLTILQLEEIIKQSQRPEHNKHYHAMKRNVYRVLGLVNDMLDLAKISESKLKMNLRRVNFAKATADLLLDVQPAAMVRNIALVVDADPEAWSCVDPTHFEKIALNLLSNALKFTEPGGRIEVAVRRKNGRVVFTVKDDGPGIPNDKLEQIFERFQQVDSASTRAFPGTGIGLALVAELTSLMGGTVSVMSDLGEGSIFRVEFPEDNSPPHTIADKFRSGNRREVVMATLSRTAPLALQVAGNRGARVLVAEDDPELAAHILNLLADKFRVMVVSNGLAALERAKRKPPHVIVSDVMMPKMDGYALCESIRKQSEFKDTGFILLTARGSLDERVRGRKIGADSYLTKPFDGEELLAAVEGVLRSRMRLVGPYLLDERLGSGGQSDVYRAEHTENGTLAAVKLIRQSTNPAVRERLALEQATLAAIRHENIVRIVDHGGADEHFYLAMEYLEGSSISKLLSARDVGLSASHTAELAIGTCRAVSAVHHAGLIHRDIKCENLMLVQGPSPIRQRLRLIDFGTVLSEPDSSALTGPVIGTIPYLAPELLDGAQPTEKTDVYAIGVAMYAMLTRKLPFAGKTLSAVSEAIALGPAPRADSVAESVPSELADIVEKAMHLVPEQRWDSADAMETAITALGLQVDAPILNAGGNTDANAATKLLDES